MATKRLRVSRPGLPQLNQGEEERPFGNKRGPLPGRGNNQGLFTPDVANRFNQARTEGGFFPALSEDSGGSGVPLGGSRPKIPAKSDANAQKEASEAFARARAAALAGGVFTDDAGNPVSDGTQITQQGSGGSGGTPPVFTPQPSPNATGRFDDEGNEFIASTPVDDEPPIFKSLKETNPTVELVLQEIAQDSFTEAAAHNVIDPQTFLPRPEFRLPVDPVTGQEVFFGTDENGNQGYGVMVEDPDFGGMVFQLADGSVQNEAQAKSAAIAAARQYFIGTDEATRDANLELLKTQVQQFLVKEREDAGRSFEADQAALDRAAQERIQRISDNAARQRDEMNNAFRAQQSNIDRALETARSDRAFALESANFELAQKRFSQETRLQNAQFALTLFQSISASPEMLHMLQSSGLVQQFQQILPGFNIAGFLPPLVEGAEATSRLAEADLPSLRELQSMPADVQTDVLVSLAIQTGVKRETIVAEIQRRATGQGLASGQEQTRRIPA